MKNEAVEVEDEVTLEIYIESMFVIGGVRMILLCSIVS